MVDSFLPQLENIAGMKGLNVSHIDFTQQTLSSLTSTPNKLICNDTVCEYGCLYITVLIWLMNCRQQTLSLVLVPVHISVCRSPWSKYLPCLLKSRLACVGHWLTSASPHPSNKAKSVDLARGSHSFTCHPHTNHICLYSVSIHQMGPPQPR